MINILLSLGSIVPQQKSFHPSKIVGGKSVASIEEYPYMVSVRYSLTHVCGGAIIDEKTVITAAQCVKGWETTANKTALQLIYHVLYYELIYLHIHTLTCVLEFWHVVNSIYRAIRIVITKAAILSKRRWILTQNNFHIQEY